MRAPTDTTISAGRTASGAMRPRISGQASSGTEWPSASRTGRSLSTMSRRSSSWTVPFREEDRLLIVESERPVRDADGHSVPEEACPEMRGRIAPLAVRPAEIVVSVGALILDEARHQTHEILDVRVGDDDRARSVQAVHQYHSVLHAGVPDGRLHLGLDVHGIATSLTLDSEALAMDEEPGLHGLGPHLERSSCPPSKADARSVLSRVASNGFGR